MSRGQIFVLSAPSGAGKSTVTALVRRRLPDLAYSVSLTTRSPRPGEVDGVDYHFVGRRDFEDRVLAGDMAEWAEVFGNLYGTSARILEETMEDGLDILLDIDVDGAAQIRKAFPEGVFIFLLPPSREELTRRLLTRGTEAPQALERRLSRVDVELAQSPNYTHLVINDVLDQAVDEVVSIVVAERKRTRRMLAEARDRLSF